MPERFIDESVEFQVEEENVSLLFRHLGKDPQNPGDKATINTAVVAELFEELQLLNTNPYLSNSQPIVVLDYRPLHEKITDPAHEVFPSVTIHKTNTILNIAHTNIPNDDEHKRYVYISKFPSISKVFNAQEWMEREFRHEIQHLGQTTENFYETRELTWQVAYYAALAMGMYIPIIYNVLVSQSRSIEQRDALIAIITGIGIQTVAYHSYRRLSPMENDARKAEKVLREKTVFQWPEKQVNNDTSK